MLENTHLSQGQNKTLRCAIYTRKSHEEGLEQEFNSLDAQRESAQAYIESQKHQGWRVIPELYDDGGFSGSTMERPALCRLLEDINQGKIDIIVVYKIDRLSRSLLDFMKMIEHFNAKGVSFVSVTQHFSTTDPTGRMFLGILITFAQYEREVIAERIRDKVAMAKRHGKYCGGVPILGYDIDRVNKKLQVNQEEAKIVVWIFKRFIQLGSAKKLCQELNDKCLCTKTWTTVKGKTIKGGSWKISQIYRLLNNPIYKGDITHKDKNYKGEHTAIIEKAVWENVQTILADNKPVKIGIARTTMMAPLKGVIRCGHCDSAMGPTYSHRNNRYYTYYLCIKDTKRAVSTCPIVRIPSSEIEQAVIEQLSAVFRTPTLVAKTYFEAKKIEQTEMEQLVQQKIQLEEELAQTQQKALSWMKNATQQETKEQELSQLNLKATKLTQQLTQIKQSQKNYHKEPIKEQDITEAFGNIERLWEELFPEERNRLIRLLVKKIELWETGIEMELQTQEMTTLISELSGLNHQVFERIKD